MFFLKDEWITSDPKICGGALMKHLREPKFLHMPPGRALMPVKRSSCLIAPGPVLPKRIRRRLTPVREPVETKDAPPAVQSALFLVVQSGGTMVK
jgi:hypothetical protein